VLVFWLYEPAKRIFVELNRATDRAAVVALGQEPRFNPYETVGWGWVSGLAYGALIVPGFALSGIAFLVWARRGLRLLGGRSAPLPAPQLLAWLLFGGFGIQLAVAILVAQSGGTSGNLQLRIFPAMLIVVSPLVADSYVRLWRRLDRPVARRVLIVALAIFVPWASAASLQKATNDPWLSNYWIFWTASEARASEWADDNLEYSGVWMGLDGIRLSARAVAEGFGADSGNYRDAWVFERETRTWVVSANEQMLAVRRRLPLPDTRGENLVYDNGEAQVVHLRPRTPYQR
jgi:hypothetical protein